MSHRPGPQETQTDLGAVPGLSLHQLPLLPLGNLGGSGASFLFWRMGYDWVGDGRLR